MVVILKISSGNIIRKERKQLYDNDKDVVFEYFRLIRNKNIEWLMDLFAPDAITYEPFSKLTGGLKGKLAIESFLKIVIMVSNIFQYRVFIEKNPEIKDGVRALQNTGYSNRGNKVVSALVVFKKGDSLNARFTFELTSAYDNYDNDSRCNKINTCLFSSSVN